MDFTLKTYRLLLQELKRRDYAFVRFEEFVEGQMSKVKSQTLDSEPSLTSLRRGKQAGMTEQVGMAHDETKPSTLTHQPSSINPHPSSIILLRHDVDRRPGNALAMAKLESTLGIKSTYYFRIVPESFNEEIIEQIAGMGHEIGYHYEEIDTVSRQVKSPKFRVQSQEKEIEEENLRESQNGKSNKTFDSKPSTTDKELTTINLPTGQAGSQLPTTLLNEAWELFKTNLSKLREIVDVKTICMHGSPFSKYDNKTLWTKYDYRVLGITGEPYFDIDWDEFGYLTDTGRRWDGESVSVRDKVNSKQSSVTGHQLSGIRNPASGIRNPESNDPPPTTNSLPPTTYRTTYDIINALEKDQFYPKVMINTHPERWNDNLFWWMEELVSQNIKNVIKKWFFVKQ